MWSARAELEYITDENWLSSDKDSSQKIHNTQIIHYSRNNPLTKQTEKYIGWHRSVCSWKGADSNWISIERKRFSNEELLDQINKIEPIFSLN